MTTVIENARDFRFRSRTMAAVIPPKPSKRLCLRESASEAQWRICLKSAGTGTIPRQARNDSRLKRYLNQIGSNIAKGELEADPSKSKDEDCLGQRPRSSSAATVFSYTPYFLKSLRVHHSPRRRVAGPCQLPIGVLPISISACAFTMSACRNQMRLTGLPLSRMLWTSICCPATYCGRDPDRLAVGQLDG